MPVSSSAAPGACSACTTGSSAHSGEVVGVPASCSSTSDRVPAAGLDAVDRAQRPVNATAPTR